MTNVVMLHKMLMLKFLYSLHASSYKGCVMKSHVYICIWEYLYICIYTHNIYIFMRKYL